METDASLKGLGAVLSQKGDDNEICVIASKLGAAQIRWLSELALYDFNIIYRTGKSNLVTDALSRHPEVEEETKKEVPPKSDVDKWITVLYQVEEKGGHISSMEFNQVISEVVGGPKLTKNSKIAYKLQMSQRKS